MKAIPLPLLNTAKLLGIIAATLVVLYVSSLLFTFVAPFVVAYLFAMFINPLVEWMSKKRKFSLSRPLAAFVTTMAVVFIVFSSVILLGGLLISQATAIVTSLPKTFPSLQENLTVFITQLGQRMSILPDQLLQGLQSVIAELGTVISSYTADAALFVFDSASSLALLFLFVIITVLATYFFSKDYLIIQATVREQVPASWRKQYRVVKCDILAALLGYLKATLIFSAVSFAQLLLGFYFLKVQYAFILAIIIAVFDALPALGTGLFLIPWSLYALITGDHTLAAGLLVLNVLVVAVRQLISPKVLGEQFGIHPISTMAAMYIGLKVLGVVGLILGPIILLILKSILGYYIQDRSFKEVIFGTSNVQTPKDVKTDSSPME
ncbi:MAG: sporulation integral membrane protein YtvI [Firmicutes bacterium]|nr:sporulation integral membrane protein YtvI [Bacillota bacterium]